MGTTLLALGASACAAAHPSRASSARSAAATDEREVANTSGGIAAGGTSGGAANDACRDHVEIVVNAPSRAGFAPGTYDLTVTTPHQAWAFRCDIRPSADDSSCATRDAQTVGERQARVRLERQATAISVIVEDLPRTVDIELARNGRSVAAGTSEPVYRTEPPTNGKGCTTAFVLLGLR